MNNKIWYSRDVDFVTRDCVMVWKEIPSYDPNTERYYSETIRPIRTINEMMFREATGLALTPGDLYKAEIELIGHEPKTK